MEHIFSFFFSFYEMFCEFWPACQTWWVLEHAQGVKIVAKEASEEVEGREGSPLNILRSQIGRFAHLHLVGFALMLCYTLEIERNWWDSNQLQARLVTVWTRKERAVNFTFLYVQPGFFICQPGSLSRRYLFFPFHLIDRPEIYHSYY